MELTMLQYKMLGAIGGIILFMLVLFLIRLWEKKQKTMVSDCLVCSRYQSLIVSDIHRPEAALRVKLFHKAWRRHIEQVN